MPVSNNTPVPCYDHVFGYCTSMRALRHKECMCVEYQLLSERHKRETTMSQVNWRSTGPRPGPSVMTGVPRAQSSSYPYTVGITILRGHAVLRLHPRLSPEMRYALVSYYSAVSNAAFV